LRELLLEINIVYEDLFEIIADLPADEIVVGTDWSKANLHKSKFEFDDRAREWMSVVENPMTLLGKKRSLDYESSIRTSNSIRSERRRSAIKLRLAAAAAPHETERQREAAEIAVKERQEAAEIAVKEKQRELELAQIEYEAWHMDDEKPVNNQTHDSKPLNVAGNKGMKYDISRSVQFDNDTAGPSYRMNKTTRLPVSAQYVPFANLTSLNSDLITHPNPMSSIPNLTHQAAKELPVTHPLYTDANLNCMNSISSLDIEERPIHISLPERAHYFPRFCS